MRRINVLLLALALLGNIGCAARSGSCCCCSCSGKDGWMSKMKNKLLYRDTMLKPDPEPEKLAVPPMDDNRFCNPINYPKEFRDTRNPKDKDSEFNPLQQGGLRPAGMRGAAGGPNF